VGPEVLEVGPDGIVATVEELRRELELVEGLVPEFSLGVGVEDAAARAWQGWGEDEGSHRAGLGSAEVCAARLRMS
jgi:hypothetical protein